MYFGVRVDALRRAGTRVVGCQINDGQLDSSLVEFGLHHRQRRPRRYRRAMTEFAIYGGVDHRGTVGKGSPRALRSRGAVLADDLREPGRPERALHGAGDVGWTVEVLEGLDEGVELRAAR
jgi:hypothetical protein